MQRDPEFEKLLIRHPAIKAEAYELIQNGLACAMKHLQQHRHLSAAEVVRGLLDHATAEFGPLAPAVLAEWGLNCAANVGDAVYNLIDIGHLSASPDDDPEDFKRVDFWFAAPVVPPMPEPGTLPIIDD